MQPMTTDAPDSPFLAGATPISDYREVEEILGSRSVRMLRARSEVPFMFDSLPLLEGEEHRTRRRQLAALFRPNVLKQAHNVAIQDAVRLEFERLDLESVLARTEPARLRVDACGLAQRIHTLVLARFVGLDGVWDSAARLETFNSLVASVNGAVSLRWSVHDSIEESASIRRDITTLTHEFVLPALRRRRTEAASADALDDLLTVLVRLHDNGEARWDGEFIVRECVAFLAGGIQSSSNAVIDALSEILPWIEEREDLRERLLDPHDELLWRAVAESLRLHPSNPALNRVALEDFTLESSGRQIRAGEELAVHTGKAARDPEIFGADADEFNPLREPSAGIPLEAWVFGSGHHSCVGRSLALGRWGRTGLQGMEGSTVTVTRAFLQAGARLDRDHPFTLRQDTYKRVIEHMPLILDAEGIQRVAASAPSDAERSGCP